MIVIFSTVIIYNRFYNIENYYILHIKPLRYQSGSSFIQKMSFFISNCKSIPKVKWSHNLVLDITNTWKTSKFKLIVPEAYLDDYYKIFSSNYENFEIKLWWKYSEREFISKYKWWIVFRTNSDTPFLKEEIIEEKIWENIKSIVNWVHAGSFQIMLNFDTKWTAFADSEEIQDVKIENTLASNNINFVKDIWVCFRFLSFKDDYIDTTMPWLVGGILNLWWKLNHISKRYRWTELKRKNISFKWAFVDFFYRLIYWNQLRLKRFSPADQMLFNSKEISYIFNFVPSDNVEILQYRTFSPNEALRYQNKLIEEKGIETFTKVWEIDYPGVDGKYFMLDEKTIRRHSYVIGKTWTGKSTGMKIFIKDDINKWRWFAVIDPNWDLADEVLDLIPEERKDDVIYVDPSVYLWRVCLSVFSFLRELGHYQQEYEIDQHARSIEEWNDNNLYHMETEDKFMSMVVNMIKAVSVWWNAHWWSRMDKIMKEVWTATLKYWISEITDISTYLNNPRYRKCFIQAIDNEDLRESLSTFETKPEKDREEAFQPVRNRFDPFLSDTMKNIFSWKPKFSLRGAMDEWKIIILRLPKGTLWDGNSALLWSMMVSLFWAMAQTRISIPESERQDFTLYIDEFQNFVTDSFSQILEEARKYKLRLVLANQFTKQIKNRNESVFDSIKWNIWTFIALWLWSDDSQVLSKHFWLDPSDMANIPPLKWYVKCEEYSPTPFNIKLDFTRPDKDKKYPGANAIKNLSYSKYGLESEESSLSDELVIAKKKVFLALSTIKDFDKTLLQKRLRLKSIEFWALLEELYIQWILKLNSDWSTTINLDSIDSQDNWYFEVFYEEAIHKEISYISLWSYFRKFKKLPNFSYNIDNYKKDLLHWTVNQSSSQENHSDSELSFNELFGNEPSLDVGIDFNTSKFDIKQADNMSSYSYTIQQTDIDKTWESLAIELGFINAWELWLNNQNKSIDIEWPKKILKKYLWMQVVIKIQNDLPL